MPENANPVANPNANLNGNNATKRTVVSRSIELSDKQKLTGSENYAAWKFLMKGVFVTDGDWELVLGEEEDEKRSQQAFYKIIFNISPSLHPMLMNTTGVKAAWELLEKNFGSTTSTGRLEIYQSLFSIKLEQFSSVADYLNAVTCLQEKLVSQNKGLEDELIAYIMLIGLPSHYDPLRMTISSLKDAVTSDFVRQRVLSCKPTNSDSALLTKDAKSQPEKKDVTCHFCKKLGHIKPDCRKYKRWLAKQKEKEKLKKTECAKLAVNVNAQCHSTGEMEKCMYASASDPTSDDSKEENAAMLTRNKTSWFIDSGASKHMCKEEYLFDSMKATKQHIRVANDQTVPCEGLGQVSVDSDHGKVNINEVLFVPGLSANLLSVSAMVDKGLEVRFNKKGCIVTKDDTIWLEAHRTGGLFVVEQAHQAFLASESTDLWHRRMGHLNFQQMKKLQDRIDCPNPQRHQCETCLECKMSRKPFPSGAPLQPLEMPSQKNVGLDDLYASNTSGSSEAKPSC